MKQIMSNVFLYITLIYAVYIVVSSIFRLELVNLNLFAGFIIITGVFYLFSKP